MVVLLTSFWSISLTICEGQSSVWYSWCTQRLALCYVRPADMNELCTIWCWVEFEEDSYRWVKSRSHLCCIISALNTPVRRYCFLWRPVRRKNRRMWYHRNTFNSLTMIIIEFPFFDIIISSQFCVWPVFYIQNPKQSSNTQNHQIHRHRYIKSWICFGSPPLFPSPSIVTIHVCVYTGKPSFTMQQINNSQLQDRHYVTT